MTNDPSSNSVHSREVWHKGNLEISFELLGQKNRPPLLLLHNACGTFRGAWQHVLEELRKRFFVVGPDLRGHGRSNNPDSRLDLREIADDLAGLLDHLHLHRVHLAGFSAGASAALYLVTRYPERVQTMVLSGTNYTVHKDCPRGAKFWDTEEIRHKYPAWWKAIVKWHGSEKHVEQLLRWWEKEDRLRPDFSPAELQAIRVPTLLIGGEKDTIISITQITEMAQWMPQARLLTFPDAGHDVIRERPQEFLTAALSFWQGCLQPLTQESSSP